jgi:hypothetical protein
VTVTLVALSVVLLAASQPAATAAAAPLSEDVALPNIASTYGSGVFGQWTVDSFGLPAYRYTMDEETNPLARQPNLSGSTDAWSQVGNTRVKADAFNHGYTELWSQDRLAQWTNYYDATHGHFSGGFGYVNVDGKVFSTLYDDRPAAAATSREFGVGYYAHSVVADGAEVRDVVFAPFGNDPLLLHQVTISNTSSRTERLSWFEYWDDNPYVPDVKEFRGIGAPTWSARTQTLETHQDSMEGDIDPLTIFAAQVGGHTGAYTTTQDSFFGTGSRSRPQAVAADRLPNRLAGAVPNGSEGTTLFALQSTEVLSPGRSVTLRYLYGYAHPGQIPGLVAKYRAAADPFAASEHAWARALPKLSVAGLPWLGREFLWDGYLLRSATVDEEECGVHTITQGDYYQYELGRNLGTRSWLHYLLPMSYADPSLARQILIYAAQFQPEATGQLPYGSTDLCKAFDLGQQDDSDFWLMLAASQYALVTRDFSFFDRQVRYYGTNSTGTLWDHIKLAFEHQQSLLGPHGEYESPGTGDWNDGLPANTGMTESTLVVAQCAYAYPQLAAVAERRGDHAFSRQLLAAAASLLATLRHQWTGQGWYSRGYAGDRQIGQGVIYLEPQPWAILAGAPDETQRKILVANILRYLDGVGAPAGLGGPDRIGTSLGPARNDPGVTEVTPNALVNGSAIWPGGTWFDPDGWLTWAYASLGGTGAGASSLAMSEWVRTTLANHSAVYPYEWDGVTSVDDVCSSFYSVDPAACGGVLEGYEGQNSEQPTWMLMDAIDVAGITPTGNGFRIAPELGSSQYSIRFDTFGLARRGDEMSGYVRPVGSDNLSMEVELPAGARHAVAMVEGTPVRTTVSGGFVAFRITATSNRAADWSLSWS